MTDLQIIKKNETHIILSGEESILYELRDIFSFYADGYKFHPKFKAKLWDGKIVLLRLTSRNRGEIYYGLLQDIIQFCQKREYSYELDKCLLQINKISDKEISEFIKGIKPSFKGEIIEPRDYQIKGFVDSINNKRNLCLSVTSSGKSFVIYMLIRYLNNKGLKGLIITPNVSLVHQLSSDFVEYSKLNNWDAESNIHKIYSGQDKVSKKQIYQSTWQSLQNIKEKLWFEQFDYVIVDECFSGDCKVLTPDGYKKIKFIKKGDIIINFDTINKKFKQDVVQKVHKNVSILEKMYELEFDNGNKIKVTGNHKFLTQEGWIRADELTETHEIISYEKSEDEKDKK